MAMASTSSKIRFSLSSTQWFSLLFIVLLVVFAGLQWVLWLSENSYQTLLSLQQNIQQQQQTNQNLAQRNTKLANKVFAIKQTPQSVEAEARYELGMIKQNEVFYQWVDKP